MCRECQGWEVRKAAVLRRRRWESLQFGEWATFALEVTANYALRNALVRVCARVHVFVTVLSSLYSSVGPCFSVSRFCMHPIESCVVFSG